MLSEIADRIVRAAVAIKAARIMADPEKFCTGYWAKTDTSTAVSCDTSLLPEYQELERLQTWSAHASADEERAAAQAAYDAAHWVEANSPAARQFCVEGACMKAAPSFRVGRAVIDGLDAVVKRDFSAGSAQSLNDSYIEGSARDRRQELVQGLLTYADEQLNGGDSIDPSELEKYGDALASTIKEPEVDPYEQAGEPPYDTHGTPEPTTIPDALKPNDGVSLGS